MRWKRSNAAAEAELNISMTSAGGSQGFGSDSFSQCEFKLGTIRTLCSETHLEGHEWQPVVTQQLKSSNRH